MSGFNCAEKKIFGIIQGLHFHRGRLEINGKCNKIHREHHEITNNLTSYTACPLSYVLCPFVCLESSCSPRVKVDILFCSLLLVWYGAVSHRSRTAALTERAHS